MAIKLQDKPNVDAPSGTYNFGNIRDNDGTGNGTPLNTFVHADFHQFFAKMLDAAEGAGWITANGLPENDDNGYQYYTTLLIAARAANKTLISVLAESIVGNNLTVPLSTSIPYVLMGLLDSGSAIAAGYIYFNGTVYRCGGLAYGTVVHALQFNVTGENFLTITDSATPGLFTYPSCVFVNVVNVWNSVTVGGTYPFLNGWTTPSIVRFRKDGNNVIIMGRAQNTGAATTTVFQLPAGYRPTSETGIFSQEVGSVDVFRAGFIDTSGNVALAAAAGLTNKTLLFYATFTIL